MPVATPLANEQLRDIFSLSGGSMKIIMTIVFALLANLSLGNAAGFSDGDRFISHVIEGRLSVTCQGPPGGPSSGSAFCQSNILDSGEYTYFIGPKLDADTVKVQATREDGSVSVVKTLAYDGVNGKSRKSINLWIRTVLQRPLLGMGKNSIHFILVKNGSTVEEGTFDVSVDDGARNICRRVGFYFSQISSDCANPQNLCGRYFGENNYCK